MTYEVQQLHVAQTLQLRAAECFFQDIIQKWPAKKDADSISLKKKKQLWTFNGVTSIKAKVEVAIDQGAGMSCYRFTSFHCVSLMRIHPSAGVMIWEVGQDCRYCPYGIDRPLHRCCCVPYSALIYLCCRRNPVHRDGQIHAATCSSDSNSLLLAISDMLDSRGIKRSSLDPSGKGASDL
jgi:hypothetical protein